MDKEENAEQLLNDLKEYFANTPQYQLYKDWEEIKEYNTIGPDIEDYINFIKKYK